MRKFYYFTNCTQVLARDVEALNAMIENARDVTYATFLRNVDSSDFKILKANFGYVDRKRDGLRLQDDYHVSYHRSRYKGKTVYYLVHSAIEYVFSR